MEKEREEEGREKEEMIKKGEKRAEGVMARDAHVRCYIYRDASVLHTELHM